MNLLRIVNLRKTAISLTALSFFLNLTPSAQAAKILDEMKGLMTDMSNIPSEMVTGVKQIPGDVTHSMMIDGPSVIRGQTYNTFVGGRVFQRMPIRQFPKLVEATMPHFSAGCGGIDMTFGSISVLDGSKLVDFMKAVAMNMTGVITQVALKAITPLLGSTLEWAKEVVDKINGFNKNSCEVAENLVAGGMKATTSDRFSKCVDNEMVYTSHNIDEARELCKTTSGMKSGEAHRPPFYGNLTWEAIKKVVPPTTDNYGERLLIMSMIGTVIYYKDGEGPTDTTTAPDGTPVPPPSSGGSSGDKGKTRDDDGEMVSQAVAPRHHAALITDMADLLYGNAGSGGSGASVSMDTIKVQVWDCGTDTDKCLSPSMQPYEMPSYSFLVFDNLKGIVDSIRNHTALSETELEFINQSTLPLYSMMSAGTAVMKKSMIAELLIDNYKDVIAADYVWALIGRSMKEGAASLRQGFDLSTPQQEDVKDLISESWSRMQALRVQYAQAQSKVVNTQALQGVVQDLVKVMHGNTPHGVQELVAGPG